MKSSVSRRSFVQGVSLPALQAAQASRRRSEIKLGMMAGISEPMLRFQKQLGVEWVATTLPATQGSTVDPALLQGIVTTGVDGARGGIGGPPGGPSGPWKEEELRKVIQQVESAGLKLGNVMLHGFPNVILGNAERDRDIENVQKSIRLAGRLGISVVEYNFYGLRNVEGIDRRSGRGGATYRGFDDARIKDRAPVPVLGSASDEEMWGRLKYFLSAVIPVAKEANVRMAQHPNDPPVNSYRGIAQPFATVEHWKRLVNFIPSPHNGITLDTGVTAENGADVIETIRYFGERNCINHVHFRNVRTTTPQLNYAETFIDEGQVDMFEAMRAIRQTGFSLMIVPDHSPSLTNDPNAFGGWGYALGYIKALIRATDS